METTVIEFNTDIEHGKARQRALFHHDPEALLNGREEFLGYVPAHHGGSELIATAGFTRNDFVINLVLIQPCAVDFRS